MMKFLHTADLHLGKNFHEYSLIEDQSYMLGTLLDILTDLSYNALVIAGDVFDRSIPSPEAVGLFGGFLGKLKTSRPDIHVLVIPGNHDSPVRLGYGRELFSGLNIHIAEEPERSFDPVIVKVGGESCACFLLPFLYPGSPGASDVAGKGAVSPLGEAARRLEAARKKAAAGGAGLSLLAAHLFCSGGKSSDSERTFLGQAEPVDADMFSGFDYVALGHLHRPQKAGKNAWYSGSPIAYSFDEADHKKYFLSVEIAAGGRRVEQIPITPRRPLRRLSGSFGSFLRDKDESLKEAENCFLEITLSGGVLTENALPILRQRFPYLLLVRQDEARAAITAEAPVRKTGSRNVLDDFREFLEEIHGEADGGTLELFGEILQSLEEEAQEQSL
ncbi:MAG: exonuclease SbcCD subunit D [Treponema sp.]|jgi:exonuclease SbcD|nr:exonuclease SbcCD subunit D [Treponema sp.]